LKSHAKQTSLMVNDNRSCKRQSTIFGGGDSQHCVVDCTTKGEDEEAQNVNTEDPHKLQENNLCV